MFFWSQKNSLPQGWSRRHLTYWDGCLWGRSDTPTIGWVFGAGEIDEKLVSDALKRAIRRRAPWLHGRISWTYSAPPTELHVPPAESDIPAFSESSVEVSGDLESVIHWTPKHTSAGEVVYDETYDPKVLNPQAEAGGVQEYMKKELPLLHLHFIKAKDATLVSLSWAHAVMDALGCAQVIIAWEQEVTKSNSSERFPDVDPSTFFDFTEGVALKQGWLPQGWMALSMFEIFHGSVYIPSSVVDRWVKLAAKELDKGEWVSRNDLVTAWMFKYEQGASFFQDSHWNTLFTALCLRGRHPALPTSYITNTAKSIVAPPITTAELRELPLSQVALRMRKTIDLFKDKEYVEKFVTQEFRAMRKNNGWPWEAPQGRTDARTFGTVSWAKLGMTGPKLSMNSPLANLTYNTGEQMATVIDDTDGNWRVNVKMSVQGWEALRKQMAVENELVKSSAE